jgi:hypothetical protein
MLVQKKIYCKNKNNIIRKDCFQVKSNLLTVNNLVFHIILQFLIKLK